MAFSTAARVACDPASWLLAPSGGKWRAKTSSSAETVGSGGRPGVIRHADGQLSHGGSRDCLAGAERGQGRGVGGDYPIENAVSASSGGV